MIPTGWLNFGQLYSNESSRPDMKHTNSLYSKMLELIKAIFSTGGLNVQLSHKASELLQDKRVASQIVDQVIIQHKRLDEGNSISVNVDSDNKVLSVTATQSTIDEKTY